MKYIPCSTITVLQYLDAMWTKLTAMISAERFVRSKVRSEQDTSTKLFPVFFSEIIIMPNPLSFPIHIHVPPYDVSFSVSLLSDREPTTILVQCEPSVQILV